MAGAISPRVFMARYRRLGGISEAISRPSGAGELLRFVARPKVVSFSSDKSSVLNNTNKKNMVLTPAMDTQVNARDVRAPDVTASTVAGGIEACAMALQEREVATLAPEQKSDISDGGIGSVEKLLEMSVVLQPLKEC